MLIPVLVLALMQSQTPSPPAPSDPALSDPALSDPAPSDAAPSAASSPDASAPEASPPAAPNALPPPDKAVEGLDGIPLKAAQLAGCGAIWLVASGASLVLSYVPFVGGCVGCVTCLVMPAVYGTTVTAVGNFLGTKQAPLLWPIVTMYVGGLVTSVVAFGAGVISVVALGLTAPTLLNTNPQLFLGAFLVPLAVTLGIAVVGAVATGVISTFVWEANAVPKTEAGQFQLALTDMEQPLFGGAPKDAPKDAPKPGPAAAPGGSSASLHAPLALPLRLPTMAY